MYTASSSIDDYVGWAIYVEWTMNVFKKTYSTTKLQTPNELKQSITIR